MERNEKGLLLQVDESGRVGKGEEVGDMGREVVGVRVGQSVARLVGVRMMAACFSGPGD